MDGMEYQKFLADFDEKIAFHNMKAKEVEHEKSRFVKEVLSATLAEKNKTVPKEDKGKV